MEYKSGRNDPFVKEKLELIAEIYDQLEAYGIEHGLSFSYSGPSGYGDGGCFDPDIVLEDWQEEGDVSHWRPSSRSC